MPAITIVNPQRKRILAGKSYRKSKKFTVKGLRSRSRKNIANVTGRTKNVMIPSRHWVQRQAGTVPFPQSFKARLPWSEDIPLIVDGVTATAGTVISNFQINLNNLNSLIDGVATERYPVQYQWLRNIYERVHVRGVKWRIEFYNPNSDGLVVGIRFRPSNDSAIATNGQSIRDLPSLPNVLMKSINNTGSQIQTMSGYCDFRRLFGLTKAQFEDVAIYGHTTAGGSPVTVAKCDLFYGNTVSGVENSIRARIVCQFYCTFSNVRTAIQTTSTSVPTA